MIFTGSASLTYRLVNMAHNISDVVEEYVAEVKQNLNHKLGEPEAQLTTPVANLIQKIGMSSAPPCTSMQFVKLV